MMFDVQRRTIGVNFSSRGEAEVLAWAPDVEQLYLAIAANNKKIPLEKQEHGYWSCITEELKPFDQYQFEIKGVAVPDPASLAQPDGVHAASVAVDLSGLMVNDEGYTVPALKDFIIYELHVGTFSEAGTFDGVIGKLDYLLELGITAIELMPVAQFPGARNWGYDGVYPFAVQHSYGGAEGLTRLVSAAHSKGIAVILDVVYNHLGPEGNYLANFGPFFTDKYKTPWGKAVNFDNAWSDGVRHFFLDNALMWLRDFKIDALRLDATHAIKDFSAEHFLQTLRNAVDKLTAFTSRPHYLLIENDLNDPRYITPVEKGGLGMDAQWNDEFHHALRVAAGQEQSGYYADFNGILHLAKAYRDVYVYDGIYSPHRHRTFGVPVGKRSADQFIVCSQNHDQVGNRLLGERSGTLYSFGMQKLLAGAVLISPFIPLLFMGEEYGETNPFQYFVSHGDTQLVEAVRRGRREEFAAFQLQGEAPDPQNTLTFLQSKLQWHLQDEQMHQYILRFYRDLIELRKSLLPLQSIDRTQLDIEVYEYQNTLAIHRWQGGQHCLCVMNFSRETQTINLPEIKVDWTVVMSSSAPLYGGNVNPHQQWLALSAAAIPPETFLLYKHGTI